MQEPEGENLAADPDRFVSLLPVLARRLPELAGLEPVATWAGLYEMTPDHNGLLGEHPERPGLFLACGFSGHGLMMAPAAGEIAAALVLGEKPFLDVSALSVDRFRSGNLFEDEAMI